MQGRNGFGTRLLAALAGLAAVALTGCSTTSTFGPPPTFAASPDYRYLIGTGDSVNVIVWRNPEVRDPVVTVIVTGASGPFSEQIRIIGEATRPQALPYRQDMTMLDVMIAVGGLTDFADGNRTVLVRGADKGKMYTVRLNDLIKRGDISVNVDVKPGDVLIIPQSWF